jgi:hypothetical protein
LPDKTNRAAAVIVATYNQPDCGETTDASRSGLAEPTTQPQAQLKMKKTLAFIGLFALSSFMAQA